MWLKAEVLWVASYGPDCVVYGVNLRSGLNNSGEKLQENVSSWDLFKIINICKTADLRIYIDKQIHKYI